MMSNVPERCFKCVHFNYNKRVCDRVFSVKVLIGHNSGDMTIETQPGLIPKYLEEELWRYLIDSITDIVDKWGGWWEVLRLRDDRGGCAGSEESTAIREYCKLVVVK